MEMSNSESYGISLKRRAARGVEPARIRAVSSAGRWRATFSKPTPLSARGRISIDPTCRSCSSRRGAIPGTFPFPLGHGFALSVVHLYPKSRGRVSLASPDPRAAPVVDPNLLGDPDDLAPTLRGLELSRRIIAAPAFCALRAIEVQPGPRLRARRRWRVRAPRRRTRFTIRSAVAAWGRTRTPSSIPQLRVHGIAGLRVADASVFPRIVGGNTNAAVVMVAEKAADMMLGMAAPAAVRNWPGHSDQGEGDGEPRTSGTGRSATSRWRASSR